MPIVRDLDNGVLIPSKSRKKLILLLDGYTYYQNNFSCNWYCGSKRSKLCPARVKRLQSGEVVRINVDHNHEPPSFYQRDGIFVRL
ncbi:Modifier of mdg4 [Operophtera brumata]|uniref:Modifier of mdg4 n=1 Tax=Operophtera brumata TaxID=104452 RepID=A0A0L7LGG4_OPEBR|nr:Modifier of mdg4 [Operophtera brumata]